jgi:hypothetical protein
VGIARWRFGPAINVGLMFRILVRKWDPVALHPLATVQERKASMQTLSSRVPIGLFAAIIAGVVSVGGSLQAATTVLVPGVNSITLDNLTGANSGNAVQVGDKLFSNFTYAPTPSGSTPTAAGVTLSGLGTGAGTDYFGIRFAGGFFDAPGGGGTDYLITYRVTVLDPNYVITDAHLASNLIVNGVLPDPAAFGTINETFTAVVPPTPTLAGVFNENFTFNNAPNLLTDDVVFTAGYTSLDVQKDIFLNAGTAGNVTVGLSFVDQRFSQSPVVPLPAAAWAGFSMLGGLGLFGVVRRRRIG